MGSVLPKTDAAKPPFESKAVSIAYPTDADVSPPVLGPESCKPETGPANAINISPSLPHTGPDRRSDKRFPFTATAILLELKSMATVQGRTTDLSEGGCYVDTMSPFPSGTLVKIRVVKNNRTFEANAQVRYSQPGIGMGICFTEIKPADMTVLRSWLEEVGGTISPVVDSPDISAAINQFPRADRRILSQLISLLIRKGVLTHSEGTALLKELHSN